MFADFGWVIILWNGLVDFLSLTWWLWAFLIIFPLFKSSWLNWRQEIFKHSREMQSILLEIRVPREVTRSIRAMDQVFMAIHALRNEPSDFGERWFDGEVTRWYSLEMVSFGGEIHFYIRTYYKQKALVEAAFFSYYSDVELVEVEDYVDRLPHNVKELYTQGYDLWGSEMMLVKEEAYPPRTYPMFESPDEEKQYDPISAFIEVLSRVKREEIVCIQFVISPAHPRWRDKYEKLIESLRIKENKKKEEIKTAADFSEGRILPALSVKGGKEDETLPFKMFLTRTPGETDILKAVENNLSKQVFDTIIRFIYLSPKELFYDSFARRSVTGSFNQYAALDLNYFARNEKMSTRIKFWYWPHFFPKLRVEWRKQRLLYKYHHRELRPETFMGKLLTSHILSSNFASKSVKLSTETLATLFHPPTAVVLTAPHMVRVESKKAGPPAGLAIYGEEKEIDKYQ